MRRLIKSLFIYGRMSKPIERNCDGGWQCTYVVVVNQCLLMSCHESRTQCGVRLKVIANALTFIHAINKAQNKTRTKL